MSQSLALPGVVLYNSRMADKQMVPYPLQLFKTKKALKEAIQLAQIDVVFVTGITWLHGYKTKKLSEMEPGEVMPFQGPDAIHPTYYGRIAKTPIRGVDLYEIQ